MTVWIDFADIRRRVTLEDVLFRMYGLSDRFKRHGKKLLGPCPIHGGRNPRSFQVDIAKGVYFCFSGCKKGGNVLDFVVAMDRITVREAALKLHAAFLADATTSTAAPAGATPKDPVAAPRSASAPANGSAKRSALAARKANADEEASAAAPNPPLDLRLDLAHDHPHIVQERGLTVETAKEWSIGYCRRGMLRGMVAIAVHNEDGELVAYVGRRLRPKEIAEFGKYRAPKHFRSDLVLYNLWRAKTLPPEDGLILVEGAFAVALLAQRGVPNVVASLGSSLSAAQADLLAEHASHVAILYDGDLAGRTGADAALALLEARGVAASVIRLPDGWKPEQPSARLLRWAVKGVRLLGLRELSFVPQPAAPPPSTDSTPAGG